MFSSQIFRTSFLVLTVSLFASLSAFAQASYEVMCRNKAKEIAAETYKNCVTEQRQTQLQQIRNDYKEKLAELKNHYDAELKKVSSGKAAATSAAAGASSSTTTDAGPTVKLKTVKTTTATRTRPSGARSLPQKKVKTEVIDLTTPSTETAAQPDESTTQSQNRLNSSDENLQDSEIVELPAQE
jgi:hypothetical protein